MKNFCIITNNDKDKDYEVSKYIKEYLESKGKRCVIAKEASHRVNEYDPYTDVSVIEPDTECAIVLGGDGTLIQAANDLVDLDIHVLGVNLGTLGFLTEIEKDHILPILDKLFDDQYSTEVRMMLYGEIYNNEQFLKIENKEAPLREEQLDIENATYVKTYGGHALNDIVISKRGLCRIITVKVYINDRLVDTYLCDGVVVSTATGSTGYNLSAGGPLVVPEIEAMMITAICPHTLNNRCIMVSPKDKIVLELGKSKATLIDEAASIFDGRLVKPMVSGDRIEITRAKEVTKLVKATDTSFFEIVRTKILKGGCDS